MGQSISIYTKHIDENNFALGQNGFLCISGSAYISASDNQSNFYWIYAISSSVLCAQSYLGDDFTFSGSFAPTSASKTITISAGFSVYGSFSAISQSSGFCLAYRG
jgi:hypothetical protein